MFSCQKTPRVLAQAISLALGVAALPAEAIDYNWVGWYSDWETASNWVPMGVPQDGDSATILSGGIVTYDTASPHFLTSVTVDGPAELHVVGSSLYADTLIAGATAPWVESEIHLSGGYLRAADLQIGLAAGSNGNFIWDGGDLNIDRIRVGVGGSGRFILDIGAGNYWWLYPHQTVVLGEQTGSEGVFEQRSGDFQPWDSNVVIGESGRGIYRHLDGEHYANETMIGHLAGGEGTYELLDDTAYHNTQRTVVGDAGIGYYVQTAGVHHTDEVIVGRNAGGEGEYQFSGGDLFANDFRLGASAGSQGSLIWTGGNLAFTNLHIGQGGSGAFIMDIGKLEDLYLNNGESIIIGEEFGSDGMFEQRSGNVDVRFSGAQIIVGEAGRGTYRQLSGLHQGNDTIIGHLAGSEGTYELSGANADHATLRTFVGDAGTGHYVQTDGIHWANEVIIGSAAGGVGDYQLSGGVLATNDIRLGETAGSQGTFTWIGGSLDGAALHIGQAGSGTFILDFLDETDEWNVQPHQSVVIGKKAGSHGVFEQRSGNVDARLYGPIIIGEAGTGTYRQLAGYHSTSETVIGHLAGGEGTYELSGEYANHNTQRTVVGDVGTGHYVQTAGVHNTNEVVIGRSAGSVGDYQMSGGDLWASDIRIGENAGSQGTFTLTGGNLDMENLHVGQGGEGTFILDTGALSDLYLRPGQTVVIGEEAGSDGVFEQRSGNVSGWNGSIVIGEAGRSTYRQLAGYHDDDETVIGHLAGGEGTYELSGEYANHNTQRTVVGDAGTGHYVQTAGVHNTNQVVVGRAAGSVGDYQLSGGDLWANDIRVGENAGSQGTFTLAGGNLDMENLHVGQGGEGTFILDLGENEWYLHPNQRVVIGEEAGSDGVFEQRSGNINAWNAPIIVGEAGRGTYRQSAGYHSTGETMIGYLAGSEGTYELTDDTAAHDTQRTVVADAGTGHYVQTAGVHFTQDLVIGLADGSNGDYALRGGNLETGTTYIGTTAGATGVMTVYGQDAYWNNSGTVYVGTSIGTNADPDLFCPPAVGAALLELRDGAFIRADAVIVGETGTVQGNGMIEADVSNNGLLSPGMGAGTLNIFGNYSQLAKGTLFFEKGGGDDLDINQDFLDIFGTANLAGTLNVSLLGGYDFIIGESFDILYANMVYGSFDSLLFPIFNGMTFDIAYDMNAVRLTVVNAVPVPAAAWLFGSGVVALMGVARRRKAA